MLVPVLLPLFAARVSARLIRPLTLLPKKVSSTSGHRNDRGLSTVRSRYALPMHTLLVAVPLTASSALLLSHFSFVEKPDMADSTIALPAEYCYKPLPRTTRYLTSRGQGTRARPMSRHPNLRPCLPCMCMLHPTTHTLSLDRQRDCCYRFEDPCTSHHTPSL